MAFLIPHIFTLTSSLPQASLPTLLQTVPIHTLDALVLIIQEHTVADYFDVYKYCGLILSVEVHFGEITHHLRISAEIIEHEQETDDDDN